jgi:hypothetical protein
MLVSRLLIVVTSGCLLLLLLPAIVPCPGMPQSAAVAEDLPSLWRSADAVVYLKIGRNAGERNSPDSGCQRYHEHETKVLEAFRLHIGEPKVKASLLQPAVPCADARGLDPAYKPGEEFIAFLRWNGPEEAFLGFVMVPVRDGRVKSPYIEGIESGMKLGDFLTILRSMME